MYLADVKFKRHKVVYNQPSELWPNNSFLNQMSQANSIKIPTQKTTSFLQKKRDGFTGEQKSKVTLKAKISPAFYANPSGPLVKKVGTSIEQIIPIQRISIRKTNCVIIWIRNCTVDSAIPHLFNNRGLLAANFCRNFSKIMLNRNCLQKSKNVCKKSQK